MSTMSFRLMYRTPIYLYWYSLYHTTQLLECEPSLRCLTFTNFKLWRRANIRLFSAYQSSRTVSVRARCSHIKLPLHSLLHRHVRISLKPSTGVSFLHQHPSLFLKSRGYIRMLYLWGLWDVDLNLARNLLYATTLQKLWLISPLRSTVVKNQPKLNPLFSYTIMWS